MWKLGTQEITLNSENPTSETRYELWSTLLVSPLITPRILPYRIHYITPVRSLDYLALGALQALQGDLFHVKMMLLCVTSTHLQIRR